MNSFTRAVERYDRVYKREWRQEVEVPRLPATIHIAYATRAPKDEEPFIARSVSEWRALCGTRVRVLMTGEIDSGVGDECEPCVERYRVVSDDPSEIRANYVGMFL